MRRHKETEEEAVKRRQQMYGCNGKCCDRVIDPETGEGQYFICGGIDTCDETRVGEFIGTVGAVLFIVLAPIMFIAGIVAGKSERTIKDTERKREEDLYCVFRIEKATEMYREECEKSGSEETKRRYRELSMMYLDEKPYTVQEISEVENISDKTVYKDIGIACGIVAIYLLGADF